MEQIMTGAQQILNPPVAAFHEIGPPFPPRNWDWGRGRTSPCWPRSTGPLCMRRSMQDCLGMSLRVRDDDPWHR
jgi:hypothetical protein